MKETLYSIRHSLPVSPEEDVETEQNSERMKGDVLKLLDDVENRSEYVPLPERVKGAEDLIKLAVATADVLELNVDIERYDGYVVFRFYDAGLYLGEVRDFYGYMFRACDSVAVLPSDELDGCNLRVDFTYYTHRYFVAGREIMLF